VKPGTRVPAFAVVVLNDDGSLDYVAAIGLSLCDALEFVREERQRRAACTEEETSTVHVCELRVIGPPERLTARLRRWFRAAVDFVTPTPEDLDREAERRSCAVFMDELDEDLASQDARVRAARGGA
jgi:hypothetical protein